MIPAQMVNRRMHSLLLWGRRVADPVQVVGRLAAMQAQEFVPAMWSVAQRCEGVDNEEMERLFDGGAILRTHILRPTWHFVTAGDIRWMLALSAPRVHTLNRYMYRREGIDDELTTRCTRLLTEALQGEQLTRTEIGDWLGRNGVEAKGVRLAYILMWAELEALICSGARRGKQHTYALLDERVPAADKLEPEDALAELTRRYFTTRGPATIKDYTKWSSLTVAQARAGLDMVGEEFERFESDGRVYWMAPGDAPNPPAGPAVDLVQGYDEVVSSYGESRDLILGQVSLPGTDPHPTLLHTILASGQVVGHWKVTVRWSEVRVDTFFYRHLERGEQAALEAAVSRVGDFFGLAGRLV